MSSGIHRQDVDVSVTHSCGFEGEVEARFDPEIDSATVTFDCPQCGASKDLEL